MKNSRNGTSLIDRRTALKGGMLAALAAGTWPGEAAENLAGATRAGGIPLREKFFGCIVAVHLGSAMAAPVEGWSWEKIEQQYGTLDRLLPYEHYRNGWRREPGTTEDGVERQKLMITAIIDKQDRVTAEDVRRIWLRDIKPESAGKVSEPFEAVLLAMAKTPIPAQDIGRYCDYSGLISVARSCHPLGLINAGDVRSAVEDVHDVGQLYNTAESKGIRWAEVTVAGIAAATKPNATVESVIGAIFDNCDQGNGYGLKPVGVLREIENGLKLTEKCADFREMRQKFDGVYSGKGTPYAQSYANEVVTKAVCVFRMVRGNTWEAIKAGVNMGRDTDCLTAVAGGLSGALSGPAGIPPALIDQVDKATALNKYTNSQRTLRETADKLYGAYTARLKRLESLIKEMVAS
ncbi:MAG TPA: ADP-ribosylglycohydrolase family protein [Verrucomicrobiae bacterium]